jgi:hypothetical protein
MRFFLSSSPIICVYAAADCDTAIDSETSRYWLRPVNGLDVQPASRKKKANANRRMVRCP